MKETQSEDFQSFLKVSKKNYAVIGPISTSNTMHYAHVMEISAGQGTNLKCFFNKCRKKYGRTKQVSGTRIFLPELQKSLIQSSVKLSGFVFLEQGDSIAEISILKYNERLTHLARYPLYVFCPEKLL